MISPWIVAILFPRAVVIGIIQCGSNVPSFCHGAQTHRSLFPRRIRALADKRTAAQVHSALRFQT